MASLGGTFTFVEELRPCLVGDEPALWHKWTVRKEFVPPRPVMNGSRYMHDQGIVGGTLALVEFLNGRVREVAPECVCFLDTKDKLRDGLEYYFKMGEVKE